MTLDWRLAADLATMDYRHRAAAIWLAMDPGDHSRAFVEDRFPGACDVLVEAGLARTDDKAPASYVPGVRLTDEGRVCVAMWIAGRGA